MPRKWNLLPLRTKLRFTGKGEEGTEGTITEYLPGKEDTIIYLVATNKGVNRPTLPDDEFEVIE